MIFTAKYNEFIKRIQLKSLFVLFLTLMTSYCALSQKTQDSAVPQYPAKAFLRPDYIERGSFSPDSKKYVFLSDENGKMNVWIYDMESASRTLLIKSDTNISKVRWNKKLNKIFYIKARCGGSASATDCLMEYDPLTGTSVKLLDASRYTTLQEESKMMIPEDSGGYVFDLITKQKTPLFKIERGHYRYVDYLEKRRQLILMKTLDLDRYQYILYHVDTKTTTALFDDCDYTFFDYDLDEKYLYLASAKEGDFQEGYKYDLDQKTLTKIITTKWDLVDLALVWGTKYYFYTLNVNGNEELHLFSDEFKTEIFMPNVGRGRIKPMSFSGNEKWFIFGFISDTSSDVYLLDLETKVCRKINNAPLIHLNPEHLVSSEPINYQARDGLSIPGCLYLPKQPKPEKGYPTLIWVHGGPTEQLHPVFDGFIQYLCNNGYAILAPNIRGSSGYGKSYASMADKDFGGKPLLDVIDAKKYLKTRPEIDANRIGIIGASYGGYMTLAALAFQPEEFKVGIDISGPSNLLTQVQRKADTNSQGFFSKFGDPIKDEEYLKEHSPYYHVKKIKAPLLIFHGEKDENVFPSQSKSMYDRIKEQHGIVEYYCYKEEGHGFKKEENVIHMLNKVNKFLKRYL